MNNVLHEHLCISRLHFNIQGLSVKNSYQMVIDLLVH